MSGLDAVFAPRRVALVGASDKPGSLGELFWRNLSDFPGDVVPVTSSTATVNGTRAYPSLTDVDGALDLAVVVVRAEAVPAVVRDAGVARVPAVLVISGGFAETGPAGEELQAELLAAARAGGVRVIGPNCFGVQNCDLPLNASMATGLPPGGGGITLATQSGSYGMAVHTLAVDERMRFAKVYAMGNKVDVGDAELLDHLVDDPASRTLCFFLESLPDGREFCAAAGAAARAGKPVIVARTGRSAAGVRAAASHTAALAGTEWIWRAALGRSGVLLARSGLEMLDAARALDTQPPPRGRRVAIITNSGGIGVELADLLADEDLTVPELSPGLQDELRPLLPTFASAANPVDVTPVWRRFAELYPMLVERLARSGEVDAVVPVLLQRAATDESVAGGLVDAVARLRADGVAVPVHVCWVAPRSARGTADLLQQAGIPCFEWPERTARALGHAAQFGTARPLASPPEVVPAAESLPSGLADPDAAAGVLRAAGVPLVDFAVCSDADAAAAAGERLGYPVVAKVVSAELVHKSDAGGVRLGLADAEALRAAAEEVLALAADARVLVARQLAGTEVVVGGLRDAQFGPCVMVGLGGVLVEVLGDVAFALAPLGLADARRLIQGLCGFPVLAGARGGHLVDVDALAEVVCAVGDLMAARPEVAELDLNPVLATPSGAVTVDWRLRVAD
ncbi:MAG: CoA-binding protein [Pseudonocardiaceae bacterium]|nr:CoA-binding protein [Pseudonocardiaceae bacterium]